MYIQITFTTFHIQSPWLKTSKIILSPIEKVPFVTSFEIKLGKSVMKQKLGAISLQKIGNKVNWFFSFQIRESYFEEVVSKLDHSAISNVTLDVPLGGTHQQCKDMFIYSIVSNFLCSKSYIGTLVINFFFFMC